MVSQGAATDSGGWAILPDLGDLLDDLSAKDWDAGEVSFVLDNCMEGSIPATSVTKLDPVFDKWSDQAKHDYGGYIQIYMPI